MTIGTTASAIQVAGTGSQFTFNYPFIADAAADITVTSIASNGAQTILSPSQYNLTINSPNPNQLWGIGGTVTYPLSGSAIPTGNYLLIQRTLPLTQTTSVQNQGNYYAQVTEQALDTLCMEIQQVAARTGLFRGTWATGIAYNYGDIAIDGVNGNNTGNYYMAISANTSSVWTTDLSNGDWTLIIQLPMGSAPLPLSIANGGTSAMTAAGAQTALGMGTLATLNAAPAGTLTGTTINASVTQSSLATLGTLAYLNILSALTGNTAGSNIVLNLSSNGNGYDCSIRLDDNVNASARIGYLAGNVYVYNNGTQRYAFDQSGNIICNTIGAGFVQKRGSNAKVGTVALAGVSAVSVSNTSISSYDFIGFSLQSPLGTVGANPNMKSFSPGVGFTVAGSSGDSSTYVYSITSSAV